MRKARLVYNPAAGQYPVETFIQAAVAALEDYGWQTEAVRSQNGAHVTQLAEEAARRGDDALFVAGGDGTINAAVRGLAGTETALGILPAGTSNVMARDLGLAPFSLTRWWRMEHNAMILAQSDIYPVDIGWCGQAPFLMWAGLGLDAISVYALEPRSRYQKYFNVPIYAYTAISTLTRWHGLPLIIEADGQKIHGRYLMAVVNNIRRYLGGLAVLSENALMDDGLMDLWLFSGKTLQEALVHALNMLRGQHLDADKVAYLTVRHDLHIQTREPAPVQLDGEPGQPFTNCHLTIQPGGLRLLVPPSALSLIQAAQEKARL